MSQIPNYPNLWLEFLPKISIFMQYFVTNYIMIYCVIVLIMYFFSAGWDDHCILYVYVLYVATNVDSNVLVLNDGKLIYNYNNDADIMPLLTCFISDTYCNICDNDKCTNFTYLAKFIFTFNTLLMVYPP